MRSKINIKDYLIRIVLTAIILLSSISILNAQQIEEKPNIIIILADDLGWGDLGFHGSEIITPNIDKLTREGIILSRFYTTPICSPTRAGIMTGKYPNRFGLRETVIPPWSEFGVAPDELFLPEYLQRAGYKYRIALGKWHLGHSKKKFLPLSRGFTHFYGHYNGAIDYFTHQREGELDWHNDWEISLDKGYSTDLISREAVKNIEELAKEQSPFFMYVAYNAPHTPLQAKKEDLELYGFDSKGPKLNSNTDYGKLGKGNTKRQTYSAMVTCMDRGIGKILNALKNNGIENNTFILFLSDNGANVEGGGSTGNLKGHKFLEWEGGVRSPAIVKWPAKFEGGKRVDQLTGYIDILPTLMHAAQVNNLEEFDLDGKDILPVLAKKEQPFNREFYLGYGSIIKNNWKLVSANAGNPGMNNKEDELFKITSDPFEEKDIKSKYLSIYDNLKKHLLIYDTIQPKTFVPSYSKGRKGFRAPKNWKIE